MNYPNRLITEGLRFRLVMNPNPLQAFRARGLHDDLRFVQSRGGAGDNGL